MAHDPERLAAHLVATAESRADAALSFLQDLIALSRHGEAAVQDHVAARLQALGCTVERLVYRPEDVPVRHEFASAAAMDAEPRESIVARFGGAGTGRSVIFFAHPDGEPVRATERWSRDPFSGVIDNGRLFGWGVADDLAGVAGFVEALATLVAAGIAPAGAITLASTPSKRHARGVFQVLHAGFRADAAVYMHPAESGVGMHEIKAVASGLLELKVTVSGRLPETREPCHTAFAHRAVNPLDKAIHLIAALHRLGEERAARIHHPALERAVGRSTNILVANLICGTAGQSTRIADHCSFGVSVAFPPGERLEDVQSEVAGALAAAARADEWLCANPPAIGWIAGVTGAEVADSHPLYRTVSGAVTRVTGHAPFVNPLHTSSDIRVPMVQAGIPTVGLGPLGGDLTQNGGHDEWVDVADYLRSVTVAALVMAEWSA